MKDSRNVRTRGRFPLGDDKLKAMVRSQESWYMVYDWGFACNGLQMPAMLCVVILAICANVGA